MVLGERFEAFVNESPVAVMVAGCLERVFDPGRLERVFEDHAVLGYAKELAFADCVEILVHVVFRMSRSVSGYYQAHKAQLPVTRQAVYQKLNGLEPSVSAGLVAHAARDLRACLEAMPDPPAPLLAGYRVRVLDGNHLARTQHRPLCLRAYWAAPLPGQALVFYDPRYDLIEAVLPCEDAYANERSLLPEALALVEPLDCVILDRGLCTGAFLVGVAERGACFVVRQHANMTFTPTKPRQEAGLDERGRALFEQEGTVQDPETERTVAVRRITVALEKPTADGQTELHVLTNLPAEVDAVTVARLYAGRWTVEGAFQRLEADLRSEIDTEAHPQAALFGFCVAAAVYNAVAAVKGAVRAAHGAPFVEEQLSSYYMAEEVGRVTPGMRIALPEPAWEPFRTLPVQAFGGALVALARRMDLRKYTKHKRGPKKPPPPKTGGPHLPHVSTARLLDQRTTKGKKKT